MNTKAKNLLILACGKGTRNAMFTFNNAIPKCLLSAGDKTILESILISYKDIVSHVHIACLPEHAAQIKSVLLFKGIHNFTLLPIPGQSCALESLYAAIQAMRTAVSDELVLNSDWHINWADLYAQMPKKVPTCTTIYTDSEYCHRNIAYETEHGIVVDSTSNLTGNVPGIFFVPGNVLYKFATEPLPECKDFDKVIAKYADGNIQLHKLSKVYDYGDYSKFTENLRSYYETHQSRYFNDINIMQNSILKRPADEYGLKLHEIEMAYYRNIAQKVTSFAKLLSYDRSSHTMELEKITGGTCQAKLDACATTSQKQRTAAKLLQLFDEAIAEVHALSPAKPVAEDEVNAAIRDEFVIAMSKRVEPVQPLIDSVIAKGVTSIDGMPITKDYRILQDAVISWCENNIAGHYFNDGITHGDPNTDNCMLDKHGNIKFIDPRGYFGKLKTLGYGIKQYDYAKFVYGMTGYSRFNRAPFVAVKMQDDGNIDTYIGVLESEGIADVDIFDLDVDDNIKILVGIIWVKLSSYIINDPERSVLAYLYGNALLTKLLKIGA